MSELISGKDALIALASGKEVEYWCETDPSIQKRWTLIKNHNEYKLSYFLEDKPRFEFRLKPHTISINGIEVPAPFKPKEDCTVFIIDDGKTCQYRTYDYEFGAEDESNWIGIWRTEEEIRQVVATLRKCFGGAQ